MSHSVQNISRRKLGLGVMAAIVCLALVRAAGAAASTAEPAEPAEPITSETLAEGDTSFPFTITATDSRHLLYRKAVIPPGASTGWHYHVGEEMAVITSGTLTRFNGADCTSRLLGPGDALVEPTGPGEAHNGINLGTEPVELFIVDILPGGAPITVPAPDPGCDTGR